MSINFQFPSLKFWDKNARKINFINEGDFWKDEVLKTLGLDDRILTHSMGAADREEVLLRQSVMKILFENPNLRNFIKNGIETSIPDNGKDFLKDFNPGRKASPFVDDVKKLIAILSDINAINPLTGGFAQLLYFLQTTISKFNEFENKFGEKVSKEVNKASHLNGRTTMRLVITDTNTFSIREVQSSTEVGYGFRHFSFRLSNNFNVILSKSRWKSESWRVFFVVLSVIFFPVGLWILFHNYRIKQLAFKPMIIEQVPDSVRIDIRRGLEDILINEPKRRYDEAENIKENLVEDGRLEEAEQIKLPYAYPKLIKDFNDNDYVCLELWYEYTRVGMKIQILRVYTHPQNLQDISSMPRLLREYDFEGYTKSYIDSVNKKNSDLVEMIANQVFEYQKTSPVLEHIQKIAPDLINSRMWIHSPFTDEEFKYYTLGEIGNLPHIYPDLKVVLEYRNFIQNTINELNSMVDILERMINRSKDWKIPLEFPKILPDTQNIIGFKTIYPIHLIGREASDNKIVKPSDLVPINSLPPLEGQIVGLTGQNGGGKTATINELVYMLYFAQSGLPVFGNDVHLNVKDTIGLVFNTRGQKSQLQNFMTKSLNILEGIKNSHSNSTVIMLDELGSGAQNEDGIDFGKKMLKALHKQKVSTIYNTQLPEVAKYSEQDLGAVCFKFDLDHHVTKGVGKGGANLLAKQIGIDKYFD